MRRHHAWTLTLFAALLWFGTGCQEGETYEAGGTTEAETQAGGATEALTEAERADGWQSLFDGQNLGEHWRGFGNEGVPQGWVAEDGAIYFNGDGDGDLMTKETYDDFELALEWKISENGNSGIMYRVVEEGHDTPWQTGPEVQVLDDEGHPDALNGPDRFAGANYALHPPADTNAVNPAGEWNQMRIVVDSAHVEHWLNGQKVVEYELWSDDWKEKVAASKFNEMPDYGMARSGHIVLQDHGDPVWFRNIKIRPL